MENLNFLSWNDLYVGRYVGDDREQSETNSLPTRTIVIKGHDTQGNTEVNISVDHVMYYQGQLSQESSTDVRGTDLAQVQVPIMVHGDVEIKIQVNSGGFVWTGVDTNYAGHVYEIKLNPDAQWPLDLVDTNPDSILADRVALNYVNFNAKYGPGSYSNNFLYAIKTSTEENYAPIVQVDFQQDPKQNFKINGNLVRNAGDSGEIPQLVGPGQVASCQVKIPTPTLCWIWYNLP